MSLDHGIAAERKETVSDGCDMLLGEVACNTDDRSRRDIRDGLWPSYRRHARRALVAQ